MKRTVVSGFSIERELLQKIDLERGDISRSRYLSRLVEQALESDSLKRLPQGSHKVGAHKDSLAIVQSKPTHCDKE